MVYRYKINNKLVTYYTPQSSLQEFAVVMTDEEANHCIGFDESNQPVYDEVAIENEQTKLKNIQITNINNLFLNACEKIGVELTGTFEILNSEEVISNPRFQYDDISRTRLFEVKDEIEVNFWRSVHSTDNSKNNINVVLNNEQKNTLYNLLKYTYYTKFAEKSLEIDSL